MRKRLIGLMPALLMMACGGGGGGPGDSNAGGLRPTSTVASDGRSRQVSATCSFTQTLGAARADNLRIDRVSWVQTVELNAAASNTRLIAGKPVLVRVDLLAGAAQTAPSDAYLLISSPGTGSCTRINLSGPASVPVAVDPQALNTAFSASVPATLIEPGASVSVVFDDSRGRTASEADSTYRVYDLPVHSALSETVRIIPITYRGQNGFVSNPAELAALMTRLHPITRITLQNEAAFAPASLNQSLVGFLGSGQESFATMQAVLSELDDECARRNGSQSSARTAPKCLGVFPNNLTFRSVTSGNSVVGLAYVGGTTMLTQSVSAADNVSVISPYNNTHWLDFRAVTVAHEYGHLLNLNHAACGGPTDTDARLYDDGRLGGGAGYDAARGFYFSSRRLGNDGQPQFGDLMSYCTKEWASDRGYLAELGYRGAGSARVAAATEAEAVPVRSHWLKLSLQGGRWQMRPVEFTPATLRVTALSLEATGATGTMALPVYAAILPDAPDAVTGPYYADLGDFSPQQLRLVGLSSLATVSEARWSAGEWTSR